ncbi:MAG: hypothetical protein QM528_03610 [Phycisphaerales bacterium]|nr:hypothetical protein [Phycisphaerales bacterium]
MKNQVKILGVTLKRNELKNVEGAQSESRCPSGTAHCGNVCCSLTTCTCYQVLNRKKCISND